MTAKIVILNWNGRAHLERFLPSVVAAMPADGAKGTDGATGMTNTAGTTCAGGSMGGWQCRLVVADNDSTDDSVAFLRREYPSIELVELDKNYGFAGGYNKALEVLMNDPTSHHDTAVSHHDAAVSHYDTSVSRHSEPPTGGVEPASEASPRVSPQSSPSKTEKTDVFILLNSDVKTPAGWCEPLLQLLDNEPDIAIVQPKIMSLSEPQKFEYAGAAGGFIDWLGYPFCRGRIMNTLETDWGQYDDRRDVFWASGAACAVRAEVFRDLGGFDARFFAHMEEIDLCWRAQLAGWRVAVEPASRVYHLGGGTLAAGSPQKIYLNFRNSLAMLRKNAVRGGGMLCGRGVVWLRMVLDGGSAAVYLLTGRLSYFRAVVRAHRDFRRWHIEKNGIPKGSLSKNAPSKGALSKDTTPPRRTASFRAADKRRGTCERSEPRRLSTIYRGSILLRHLFRKTFGRMM